LQVTPVGHNLGHDRAFSLGVDQRIDQIELIHRHKLENFAADFALLIARQRLHDLQMLRFSIAENFEQFMLCRGSFDKGIETGAGTAIGKRHNGDFTNPWMLAQARSDHWRLLGESDPAPLAVGEI